MTYDDVDYEQAFLDAIARLGEIQASINGRPDSNTAVDTSEVDSPVVANMNVEAEESVEFNPTVEDAEVGGTPTTEVSQETAEVEESHSIAEVREIEESNSSAQPIVEITETESQTTIQGDVVASEDLPEESGTDMISREDNINSSEENQRINVNSPVYPSLYSGESEAPFCNPIPYDEEEYVQPDPDSFLPFDPCGVDVDFYGYEYHENVRQLRREAEGVVEEGENDTDGVMDLDEVLAAYRERINNTSTSVRRDISEEDVVNSPAADNQDISEEDVVNSPAADNQDISGEDVVNSPAADNHDISEDIDKDVPNSPSVLSQDISGEEDIDIILPMPRPNSEGEIVFDCIIARSIHPEGNEMSELVAAGFIESYL